MNKIARVILAVFAISACVGESVNTRPPGSNGGPGGGMVPPPMGPPPPPPYEALPPNVYAAKVKDVLTGMPLTDAELAMVTANPRELRTLIDMWTTTPLYRERMFDFFKTAFQQTQLAITDLDDMLRLDSANVNRTDQARMLRAVEETFPRTVLALIDENRPFSEVITTNRFMLNVPMMVALAYMDAAPRDDNARSVTTGYWSMNKFGGTKFTYTQVTNVDPATGVAAPIPFEQSIDPTSPNFMKFTFTQPDPMRYMPCPEPVTVTGTRAIETVFGAIFGSRDACQGAPAAPTLFTEDDWNNWRMVTIRPPKDGAEERTLFWDLPKMRTVNQHVLAMPRVGFMTTLAFFANWATNTSNQYRVTMNQTLIVALGRSFDDRSSTVQVAEQSAESLHVQPGTPCYGCHVTLDPKRDFIKQSYSLTYFQQLGSANNKRNPIPATATFTVDGSAPVSGNGVGALAQAMSQHPLFPIAWTQKLCQLANSSRCETTDPELQRVAGVFRDSKFDFKVLVRELFTSPLVTYAAKTKNAETEGVVIGIARRETLCTRLSNRLGIHDICNLKGESALPRASATSTKNLSLGVAGSTYARADEQPVMPHDPNLFFTSGTEKLCTVLAGQLVETTTAKWKVATKDAALDEFVSVVMGLPANDDRAPLLRGVLLQHYNDAIAAKEKAPDALRSAFVLACSSPLAISAGL
jgi:hypothetical protein